MVKNSSNFRKSVSSMNLQSFIVDFKNMLSQNKIDNRSFSLIISKINSWQLLSPDEEKLVIQTISDFSSNRELYISFYVYCNCAKIISSLNGSSLSGEDEKLDTKYVKINISGKDYYLEEKASYGNKTFYINLKTGECVILSEGIIVFKFTGSLNFENVIFKNGVLFFETPSGDKYLLLSDNKIIKFSQKVQISFNTSTTSVIDYKKGIVTMISSNGKTITVYSVGNVLEQNKSFLLSFFPPIGIKSEGQKHYTDGNISLINFENGRVIFDNIHFTKYLLTEDGFVGLSFDEKYIYYFLEGKSESIRISEYVSGTFSFVDDFLQKNLYKK